MKVSRWVDNSDFATSITQVPQGFISCGYRFIERNQIFKIRPGSAGLSNGDGHDETDILIPLVNQLSTASACTQWDLST
jgi:hypothetical protein